MLQNKNDIIKNYYKNNILDEVKTKYKVKTTNSNIKEDIYLLDISNIRYTKDDIDLKFLNKIVTLSYDLKCLYETIRRTISKYSMINIKHSSFGDEFYYETSLLFKVGCVDGALRLYFNLNINLLSDYDVLFYRLESFINYNNNPILLIIKDKKDIKICNSIILKILSLYNLNPDSDMMDSFIDNLCFNSNDINKVLNKKLDLLSDDDVNHYVVLKHGDVNLDNVFCISVGELSYAFSSEYMINLNLLKKIGICDNSCTYLKVTNGGFCNKPLNIEANDFDFLALKMIITNGGNVCKII